MPNNYMIQIIRKRQGGAGILTVVGLGLVALMVTFILSDESLSTSRTITALQGQLLERHGLRVSMDTLLVQYEFDKAWRGEMPTVQYGGYEYVRSITERDAMLLFRTAVKGREMISLERLCTMENKQCTVR